MGVDCGSHRHPQHHMTQHTINRCKAIFVVWVRPDVRKQASQQRGNSRERKAIASVECTSENGNRKSLNLHRKRPNTRSKGRPETPPPGRCVALVLCLVRPLAAASFDCFTLLAPPTSTPHLQINKSLPEEGRVQQPVPQRIHLPVRRRQQPLHVGHVVEQRPPRARVRVEVRAGALVGGLLLTRFMLCGNSVRRMIRYYTLSL